ncbi:MAG: DUF302 domain-containing protein [Candidatus Sericytochromatia bacterium]|nr:DUF302 domain-containing protein [Candidatus Tanganyikabacteria bacterium]
MTGTVATRLAYTVESDRPFDDAVAAVEAEAAAAGFRVLHVHDVAATLASKGFDREPYKIVEVCQAAAAHEALGKEPLVGLLMPCKINAWTHGGKTVLSAIRPALLAEFFPEHDLGDLAARVERQIVGIVDRAR